MSASSPSQSGTPDTRDSLANGAPKKRRRAAIACRECRSRKTKCDHIVPVTASDEMLRGLSKTSQVYIRSLERRLRIFEESHRGAGSARPLDPGDATNVTPLSTPHHPLAGSEGGPRARRSSLSASPPTGQPRQTIISANPDILIGGKAGESFTQLILNAMNRGSARLETHSFSSPRDHHPDDDLSDARILAPPPGARELMKVYFDFHHVLTPIFHAPTITNQLEQVLRRGNSASQSSSCDHPTNIYTLAILNMICAIATAHDRLGVGGDTASVVARRYYDTAMRLVRPTLLSDWSVEKVQILLLGARYLQSASYPDECWTVLGLAVRIAYGLDLHRPPPEEEEEGEGEKMDCIAREVRKRVWHACYGMDQLLSMIYGRPAATSAATFTAPLPEDLDDDCIQPTRLLYPSVRTAASCMSFFLQVSRLYRILESAASLGDPSLEARVRLDEDFETWYAQVPETLKVRPGSRADDDKALILALRANMVRILIHRPSLVSALSALSTTREGPQAQPSPQSQQQQQPLRQPGRLRVSMLQRSRQICVSTAEETVQLVSQRHEQTKNATGPSWFNLYYLFNAILVIVSHVVDPEFRDDRSALRHLEQAMHMIRQMSANHLCAQRAYTFLQQLLGLLDKTLPDDRQRFSSQAERNSTPPPFMMGDAALGVGGGGSGAPEDMMVPDLWSLWGATQDLTIDLGSQLEMHSSLGSAMWSWGGQDAGASVVLASPSAGSTIPC
ncbi:hypothetical protein VTK73DRAFT_6349 [Phialemonium thermophilum]|uniref:Xylanolytic transcriptional activator regulatory domain-containing protein n=1 Tax=Phialemonium thermophilum TaxID=223376 RepID=A0ABR3WKE5_9PEZI